jgi:hypothetical protein
MNLIASRPFPYRGSRLSAGQEFTASRRDSRLLVAIGYATARVEPEPEPDPEPDPEPEPVQRRTYRRRDMRAEQIEGM